MQWMVAFLLMVLVGLQYKLWLGNGSITQWLQLEKKLTVQIAENQKLTKHNQDLENDVLDLQSGDQSLEEQARMQLGMVKDGEVYYHFMD